jgi:hypothetical protein
MRALVVYESMFGNTEQVARAVVHGLSNRMEVELAEVSAAPAPLTELPDLIVVGAPTHAFSLSRPSTRADALRQGATQGEQDTGLREWLARLSPGPHSEMVAAFDTRVERVRHLPGSAAKRAARVIDRLGYERIGRESFYVVDVNGPLEPGELARAEQWGRHLAAEMALRSVGGSAEGSVRERRRSHHH